MRGHQVLFTREEREWIEKESARIHELAMVADGDPFETGLTLREANEERAIIEQDMTELLFGVCARAGWEV